MDSPILNVFLADCFRLIVPIPREVDWFYIGENEKVRSFTCSMNSESWRETTNSANTSPNVATTDSPSEGQRLPDFRARSTVHPGYKNVNRDGLRMYPMAHSNEECDSLDSRVDFVSEAEIDFQATTDHPRYKNATWDGLRMHPIARPTLLIELETFSNEEWDSLDSWSSFERGAENISSCDREPGVRG